MTLKVFLKYSTGLSVGHFDLQIGQSLSVGRSSNVHVKLDDPTLSGTHCSISFKKNKLEISDLESKNGTYVNGIRINISNFFIGDEIRLGKTTITIDQTKMDEASIKAFTFAGNKKERAIYGLKVDFTGAEAQKVLQGSLPKQTSRLKAKRIHVQKFSKEQIKSKYVVRSTLASFFDIIFVSFSLLSPVFLTHFYPRIGQHMKGDSTTFIIFEISFLMIFFILNFKILKFSFGEKLVGIEEMYLNQ